MAQPFTEATNGHLWLPSMDAPYMKREVLNHGRLSVTHESFDRLLNYRCEYMYAAYGIGRVCNRR